MLKSQNPLGNFKCIARNDTLPLTALNTLFITLKQYRCKITKNDFKMVYPSIDETDVLFADKF